MAEEVDAKLLKQVRITQDLLGEFVKRPSLTEKHLMRPPFRYLHDIVMAVIDSTGFFRGLFTTEELNPATLVSKESKATFIEKVVAVVEISSGQKLEIRANKILAGQEADKTNILLQTLAKCLQKKQSSNEAVKSITGSDPDERQTKGGRRGSNSKESTKTKPTAATAGRTSTTVGSQDAGKSKTNKDKAGTSTQHQSRANDGVKAHKSREVLPDKNIKSSTSKAGGAYGKPVPKTVGAPVANKTKGARRGSSQEVVPSTSSKPMRVQQPQPALSRELAQQEREEENIPPESIISRSRKGSIGSPNNDTGARPKEIVSGSDEEDVQPSSSPPAALMGEMEFILNQYGYNNGDIGVHIDEKVQTNNGFQLVGDSSSGPGVLESQVTNQEKSEETIELIEDYPQPTLTTQSKSSADFASGEDNDDDDMGNLDNNISRSPAPPPVQNNTRSRDPITTSDVLVKPVSAVKGVTQQRERPLSRSNVRQLTEQQIRDQQVKQDNQISNTLKENENTRPMTNSIPEKMVPATGRPPTTVRNRPPTSARPSSARPGAPRPKSALVVQVDENAFRPPTGKVVNVLMDNEDLEDDGDNYIVQELPPRTKMLEELDETPELALGLGQLALGEIDSDVPESQRGLFLNQILETQKELEGSKSGNVDDGSGDTERSNHIRETTKIEIEKLQNLIQTTAKVAHPLGKLMDFIQEDVDSIYQELNKWNEESKTLDFSIEEELAKTEKSLEPLRLELSQIEDSIQDQEDAIDSTRMEIQQQEARIVKILSGFEMAKPLGEYHQTIQLPPIIKVFGIDVELGVDDRKLVIGDGSGGGSGSSSSKIESFEIPSTIRTRPKSQYKNQWTNQNQENNDQILQKENFNIQSSEIDIRTRMKNLASTMARENLHEEDDELEEGRFVEFQEEIQQPAAAKTTRQRRLSISSTHSNNQSPNHSPAHY